MMTFPRLAVLVAAPLCLVISCGDASGRLAKLRSDPMAHYELPSALSTRTSEITGGYSSVDSPSMITRTFTVPDGDAEAAMTEIAEAASEAGWTVHENKVTAAFDFSGEKRIDDLRAQISITGLPLDNVVWFQMQSRS